MKIAIIMPLAEQRGRAEIALLHLIQQGQGLGVDWLVIFLSEGPMVARARELDGEAVVIDAGRLREVPKFTSAVIVNSPGGPALQVAHAETSSSGARRVSLLFVANLVPNNA